MEESVTSLEKLGFTALEAQIYAFLLQESPATGYRVAQAIGRPMPGTYKALESLQNKGAIVVADGKSRLCRAVPWKELLSRLESEFSQHIGDASEALARIQQKSYDDRIYELSRRSQVLERCRQMISPSRELVLADLYPQPAALLASALSERAAQGVEIVAKVYEPIEIPGVRLVLRQKGNLIYEQMPGEVISLSVDGAEHLLAFLKPESQEVFQALWTQSAMLADRLHEQLVHELILTELKQAIGKGARRADLEGILKRTQHLNPVLARGPSYRNLLLRFGLS